MKQRIQKGCRLGDTEITISFYGPIGNASQAITKRIDVERLIQKAASSLASKIKELTDQQIKEEIQPLVNQIVTNEVNKLTVRGECET